MPRVPDKKLEERILAAAARLWRERRDKGLTLRAVARAARTTTPTVYKRFQNKRAIKQELAWRIRGELLAELFASSRVEEAYRRYLAYAESHPHEYDLLRIVGPELSSRENPHPGRVWGQAQLAARFGGRPEDYNRVVQAIFLLCHGTSTLMARTGDAASRETLRAVCIETCDRMLEHIEIFRSGAGREDVTLATPAS